MAKHIELTSPNGGATITVDPDRAEYLQKVGYTKTTAKAAPKPAAKPKED